MLVNYYECLLIYCNNTKTNNTHTQNPIIYYFTIIFRSHYDNALLEPVFFMNIFFINTT